MNTTTERCRPTASSSRRLTRLLWLLPLIMAMEGPTCVMSEQALTRSGRGAVDEALLGEWIIPDFSPASGYLRVGIADRNTMEFRVTDSEGTYMILTGHTSHVGEMTFANLQFVGAGCDACDAATLAELQAEFDDDYGAVSPSKPGNRCTYYIVRYDIGDDGTLRYYVPKPGAFLAAIEAGELTGDDGSNAAEGEYDDICLTGSRRELRNVFDTNVAELFDLVDEEVMVRAPAGERD